MLDIPVSVLEMIARIDGGIVLDQDSNLLAFGAILRHHELTDPRSAHHHGPSAITDDTCGPFTASQT